MGRCAAAKVLDCIVANELGNDCGFVVPEAAHMMNTWIANATGPKPLLFSMHGAVFRCKGAPGNVACCNGKGRGLMEAHQT